MPEPGEATQVGPLYLPFVTDAAGDLVASAPGWLDLTEVRVEWMAMDDPALLSTVLFELANQPPIPFPDPDDHWVAYGLVADVDGDGCGDLRIGMDNAPGGEHRAWVTDLATGVTQAKTGPNYGYAGDFFWDTYWPGQSGDLDPDSGKGLLSRAINQLDLFRFYVWASLIEDGQLIATDYAPDIGWIDPGEGTPLR